MEVLQITITHELGLEPEFTSEPFPVNNIGYIEKKTGEIVRVEALGDKCVIKLDARPKQTAAGLYLPDRNYVAGQRPSRAYVVAVGPNVSANLLIPGCYIHITKYSGTAFDFGEDQEYHAVYEADILGVEVESSEIQKLIEDWENAPAGRPKGA